MGATFRDEVLAALPGRALEISKQIGLWAEMHRIYGANGETYVDRTSSGQVANVLRKAKARGLVDNDSGYWWYVTTPEKGTDHA